LVLAEGLFFGDFQAGVGAIIIIIIGGGND
jgi:hypothetical protein